RFSSGVIFCNSSVWGDPVAPEGNICEYSNHNSPTPAPTPTPAWILCAHPGETCMLPAHDQLASLGIPQAGGEYNNLIVQVAETSIECSPSAFFPDLGGLPSRDCYYLQSDLSYDGNPFGILVTNRGGDFWDLKVMPDLIEDPFFACNNGGGLCRFER